ncbi:thioredoxin family protein [Spirillospora sp. NBC_00431]
MSALRLPLVLAIALAAATACGTAEPDIGAELVEAAPTAPSVAESPAASPTPLPRAYDPKADAKAEIKAALAKAKRDRRPVLLDFGARWCPDCVLLEHTFRRDAVRPLLDAYHVVSIDVDDSGLVVKNVAPFLRRWQ